MSMNNHRTYRPTTQTLLRRRDNALGKVRADAAWTAGAVTTPRPNPVGYQNARSILTTEFGYTDADIMAVRRSAAR